MLLNRVKPDKFPLPTLKFNKPDRRQSLFDVLQKKGLTYNGGVAYNFEELIKVTEKYGFKCSAINTSSIERKKSFITQHLALGHSMVAPVICGNEAYLLRFIHDNPASFDIGHNQKIYTIDATEKQRREAARRFYKSDLALTPSSIRSDGSWENHILMIVKEDKQYYFCVEPNWGHGYMKIPKDILLYSNEASRIASSSQPLSVLSTQFPRAMNTHTRQTTLRPKYYPPCQHLIDHAGIRSSVDYFCDLFQEIEHIGNTGPGVSADYNVTISNSPEAEEDDLSANFNALWALMNLSDGDGDGNSSDGDQNNGYNDDYKQLLLQKKKQEEAQKTRKFRKRRNAQNASKIKRFTGLYGQLDKELFNHSSLRPPSLEHDPRPEIFSSYNHPGSLVGPAFNRNNCLVLNCSAVNSEKDLKLQYGDVFGTGQIGSRENENDTVYNAPLYRQRREYSTIDNIKNEDLGNRKHHHIQFRSGTASIANMAVSDSDVNRSSIIAIGMNEYKKYQPKSRSRQTSKIAPAMHPPKQFKYTGR